MITDKYMKGMEEMIEHLSTRLDETTGAENRLYQIMLEATINSYEAKLKLKMQDDKQATT
tara:strand:- start:25843 stop:26022 length:180 start_codon:yes stop_codon:yes gene_type:complete